MFSKRLNVIMTILNINNATLARKIGVHASYISKLRSGKRIVYNKQGFLNPLVEFLSVNFDTEYKKTAFCLELKLDGFPDNQEILIKILKDWLSASSEYDGTEKFLRMFSTPELNNKDFLKEDIKTEPEEEQKVFYYGPEGKREVIIRFLKDIINSNVQQSVLFFCDEDMGWLTENRDFAHKYINLVNEMVSKGNTLKIIHNIHKDIYEIIESISKWIPLYSTGKIEPYYYPKIKDGIFQHSIFVAPKSNVAFISSSVRKRVDDMLHIYIKDEKAINSLTQEYYNYLSLCKPFLQTYDLSDLNKVRLIFEDYYKSKARTIILRPNLPVTTLPAKVADEMMKKCDTKVLRTLNELNKELLDSGSEMIELVSKPPVSEIESNKIYLKYSPYICHSALYLTKEEYFEHLKYTEECEKKYPNYKVHIMEKTIFEDIVLCYKEEVGTLIFNYKNPAATFFISEPIANEYFGQYLKAIAAEKDILQSKIM